MSTICIISFLNEAVDTKNLKKFYEYFRDDLDYEHIGFYYTTFLKYDTFIYEGKLNKKDRRALEKFCCERYIAISCYLGDNRHYYLFYSYYAGVNRHKYLFYDLLKNLKISKVLLMLEVYLERLIK